MTDKLLLTLTILTAVSMILLVLVVATTSRGYFRGLDVSKVHTMRVYEDGSYVVEFQDKTTTTGCVPGGLCNE